MNLAELKIMFQEVKSWDKDISSDVAIDIAARVLNTNTMYQKKENFLAQSTNPSPKQINPITDRQKKLLIKAKEQGAYKEEIDNLSKAEAWAVLQELMGK